MTRLTSITAGVCSSLGTVDGAITATRSSEASTVSGTSALLAANRPVRAACRNGFAVAGVSIRDPQLRQLRGDGRRQWPAMDLRADLGSDRSRESHNPERVVWQSAALRVALSRDRHLLSGLALPGAQRLRGFRRPLHRARRARDPLASRFLTCRFGPTCLGPSSWPSTVFRLSTAA